MTHYPSDYAPKPISSWHYLSPYLPSVGDISSLDATIYSMLPDKANRDREERWRKLCMPMRDPDETTSLTYSSDNNLTHTDLANGNDLDFKYDAAGRRVEKTFTTYVTSGTTTTTTVTTYKYHYIGSQITTIEIDQTQTVDDGEETPVTTTTKDDEIRIHLGANSRPISFEYYTENQGTQQTTSATYYYHYDLHGNVIRVTNSSGTTVISYTYDQLGTIVSETNSSSIYNPFTYMGEAQVIHDCEFDTSGSTPLTGLYSSGSGYYNPKTGTFLGGSGAPASANPSSTSAEEPTAQSTRPASQLGAHAAIAAVGGGVSSTKTAAASIDVEPEPAVTGMPVVEFQGGIQATLTIIMGVDPSPRKANESEEDYNKRAQYAFEWYANMLAKQEEERRYKKEFDRYWNLTEEEREAERKLREEQGRGKPKAVDITPEGRARGKIDNWDAIPHDDAEGNVQRKTMDDYNSNHSKQQNAKWFAENLVWAAWGHLNEGYTGPNGQEVAAGYYLFGYQVGIEGPRLFWGPGGPSLSYFRGPGTEYGEWKNPFGQRLGATTFMRSWTSRYGGALDITWGCVNNTG